MKETYQDMSYRLVKKMYKAKLKKVAFALYNLSKKKNVGKKGFKKFATLSSGNPISNNSKQRSGSSRKIDLPKIDEKNEY